MMISVSERVIKCVRKGEKCWLPEFSPFYVPPPSKDRGHIVLPLSVCLSIGLHKLNMKT